MKFNKQDLIAIEKHIDNCKGDIMAIAADDNDKYYTNMGYECECGSTIKRPIRKEKPIDRVNVKCPICNRDRGTVIINLIS